jgi:tetratricopeptide (TPR) repeat protein
MSKKPAIRSRSCSLVRTLVADWAKVKGRPFPYLQVGEHLAECPSCLSWATAIAYKPTEHYARALHSRLSTVIGYLGQSVLRAWSNKQDLGVIDVVSVQDPATAPARVSRCLSQCESFNPELKEEAAKVRALMPDVATGVPPTRLEPYALAHYFLETALAMAPQSENRFNFLNQLGITEHTQAVGEQRAGRKGQADHHFQQAKEYYQKVMAVDVRDCADVKVVGRIAQVWARLDLAQVEYVQGGHSQPALQKAIELCLEAKQLVAGLGLDEKEFTLVLSNLLICYLRLFLDHDKIEAYDQAQKLAREACAKPTVARVFVKRWVVDGEDPELTQLLASPRVKDLSDYLKQEAQRVLHPESNA